MTNFQENPKSSRNTGLDSPKSPDSRESDSRESPDSTESPDSIELKELNPQEYEEMILEETNNKLEFHLHTRVVVTKDYPEFNVFTGYMGLIIDFPSNSSTVCLVEFDDFSSPERNEKRHDWFYLSKEDLITYYSCPLLTFKKRLHWSRKKFLV